MGIVLDMIGQGGAKVGAKAKNPTKDVKADKATEEEKALGSATEYDKESEFQTRKSKSEKFRTSMRKAPGHKGKFSMGGARIKKAK